MDHVIYYYYYFFLSCHATKSPKNIYRTNALSVIYAIGVSNHIPVEEILPKLLLNETCLPNLILGRPSTTSVYSLDLFFF